MVRETSYKAYVELKLDGKIGAMQEKIYELFYCYPGYSDLDISIISKPYLIYSFQLEASSMPIFFLDYRPSLS